MGDPLKTHFSYIFLVLVLSSCAEESNDNPEETVCIEAPTEVVASSTGEAYIFDVDPIISSGDPALSPSSLYLDNYRKLVTLEHLDGTGVLNGQYVSVREGLICNGKYKAQEDSQSFLYTHDQPGYQEAMTYYFSDGFRSYLDQLGALAPTDPVMLVAHCMEEDNAFFVRYEDETGATTQLVCLGDSTATEGASYADDAAVTIHELQHATTVETYSPDEDLNQFWYDEAGGLNEAVSDFMALLYLSPSLGDFDPKLFSRWALGTFIPGIVGSRGAHRCPVYDPSYPDCIDYESGAQGFSAESGTASYSYPDGLGWPYANNFNGPGYLRSIYEDYSSQEEIHNTSTLLVGALWDAYEAVLENYPENPNQARALLSKLVLEAIKHLPMPTSDSLSPVTYRGYASNLMDWALGVGFTEADLAGLEVALAERGLSGDPELEAGWATIGDGVAETPGLRVLDNPVILKSWFIPFGYSPETVPQGIDTGLNGRLDPGELVALWFDVGNSSEVTAGGLELRVTSLSEYIEVESNSFNDGAISTSQAQIRYFKVNGSGVVEALTHESDTYDVPTGSSYFLTNPYFDASYGTALWVSVHEDAPSGESVQFQVVVQAPNAAEAETLVFETTIQ